MHIAREQQRRFTVIQHSQLVSTTTHFLTTLRGIQETMAHQDLLPMERKPSAASLPTDLAFTTWQAMFGSGARIGIAVRTTPRAHLQTPQDRRLVLPVCCAAAAGTSASPAAAARRSATKSRPSASTFSTGSVSRGLRKQLPHTQARAPPFYGQKSLIFGSFLPVNRGFAFRTALSTRKPEAVNLQG